MGECKPLVNLGVFPLIRTKELGIFIKSCKVFADSNRLGKVSVLSLESWAFSLSKLLNEGGFLSLGFSCLNFLNLDTSKPLTITGGLTWAGGPLNNYVMHSIVRMVELLREAPTDKGLITANGGYLTKHAFGVYSAEAPPEPYKHEDLQAQIDVEPTSEVVLDHNGVAEVEAYAVTYGADGLSKAFIACQTESGQRAWAVTEGQDTMASMVSEEFVGRSVQISAHNAQF